MLYVNASILHETPSGLGVYAKNVIEHLARLDPALKVFSPVDLEGLSVTLITRFVKPSYRKLGAITRVAWTQGVLPFRTAKEDTVYHPFHYLSLCSWSRQVMTVHDFIPLYFPEAAPHQYHYYRRVMPRLLKRADRVICDSENTKQDIIKFYGYEADRLTVVPLGYDRDLFNETSRRDGVVARYGIKRPYILMVGAGYPHKNLHRVIQAFSTLADRIDHDIVIIGGDSSYRVHLSELVHELRLEKRVRFAGYVPDADLPSFYADAACFAYPTLYEGFGLPILEAMACGAPVVCSNTSSLPEVAGDAALMFDPEDEEEIAHCLERVLTDSALRDGLRARGRENTKRFSWEATARGIYSALI